MLYSISYDLNDRKDYAGLFFAISSLGDHIKPLKSLWLVDAGMAPIDSIYTALMPYLDADDTMFIQPVPKGCRWKIQNKDDYEWIRKHL